MFLQRYELQYLRMKIVVSLRHINRIEGGESEAGGVETQEPLICIRAEATRRIEPFVGDFSLLIRSTPHNDHKRAPGSKDTRDLRQYGGELSRWNMKKRVHRKACFEGDPPDSS